MAAIILEVWEFGMDRLKSPTVTKLKDIAEFQFSSIEYKATNLVKNEVLLITKRL